MESYRVRKSFQWDGWVFAPGGGSYYPRESCRCQCAGIDERCSGQVATDCSCADTACHCDCGIKAAIYGGDVWFVLPGHSRKEIMLEARFAVGDPSLPSADEMLEREEYQRLKSPPKVPAGRK